MFTRKIRRKNAAKNLEDISFSIFLGCGKNKEFWPEYSPLIPIGPVEEEGPISCALTSVNLGGPGKFFPLGGPQILGGPLNSLIFMHCLDIL